MSSLSPPPPTFMIKYPLSEHHNPGSIRVKNTALSTDEQITNTWRTVMVYALITLLGFNLRSVILAVPPVLPLIQRDLGLSYSETGLLTALPVLVLAVGALPAGF